MDLREQLVKSKIYNAVLLAALEPDNPEILAGVAKRCGEEVCGVFQKPRTLPDPVTAPNPVTVPETKVSEPDPGDRPQIALSEACYEIIQRYGVSRRKVARLISAKRRTSNGSFEFKPLSLATLNAACNGFKVATATLEALEKYYNNLTNRDVRLVNGTKTR